MMETAVSHKNIHASFTRKSTMQCYNSSPAVGSRAYENLYESAEKTQFLARFYVSHSTTETGFLG